MRRAYDPPASRSRTLNSSFSVSRLATTEPAVPPIQLKFGWTELCKNRLTYLQEWQSRSQWAECPEYARREQRWHATEVEEESGKERWIPKGAIHNGGSFRTVVIFLWPHRGWYILHTVVGSAARGCDIELTIEKDRKTVVDKHIYIYINRRSKHWMS